MKQVHAGVRVSAALAAMLLASAAASAQDRDYSKEVQIAKGFLAKALQDSNTTDLVLASLRLTGDADLTPLFAACAGHTEKRVRMIAVTALSDHASDATTAALIDRAKNDPVMSIRAQAIAILVKDKAATAELLKDSLQCEDESVQYLAARGLVSLGQGAAAAEKLAKLAESKDLATAGLARMDLLAMGRAEQLEPATKMMTDPGTSSMVVGMMLGRVHEDKIAAAVGIAERIAESNAPEEVRLHAFRAVSAVSPEAARLLYDAVVKSDKAASQVFLFRMLADLVKDARQAKEASAHLQQLSKGTGLPAALARLELARPAADASTAKAAAEVVGFKHPIVLEQFLAVVRDDLTKAPDKANVYTPVLLDILRNTPEDGDRLRSTQEVCARAATILGDIGTPAALDGLKAVLAGSYGEPQRAAAGGLVRSKNAAVAELAKPLLESPYPELATTAGICMARHGNKEALRAFQDVLTHANRFSPDLVAIASWYTLKLSGEHTAAIQELAKALK